MTRVEAAQILHIAKWVMSDMNIDFAVEASRIQFMLEDGRLDKAAREAKAVYILPRGKRGHVVLVLNPPEHARAAAFLACLLRNIEGP